MENEVNNVKPSFSDREKEVAEMLAAGYSEKEIANELNIAPSTVNNHTRNIRNKLGLNKSSQIVTAYIAYLNGKPYNLSDIRKYGISIILVLLNICEFNKGI